jgi:uncharacterized protein (DUF433 family)
MLLPDFWLNVQRRTDLWFEDPASPASPLARGMFITFFPSLTFNLNQGILMAGIGVTESKMRLHNLQDAREAPRYGITEAAGYLGLPVATLKSWVQGRSYPTRYGKGRFKPLAHAPSPGMLSFFNLVETHILLSTRKYHGLTMPAIRHAMDYVAEQFPSPHPLLSEQFLTDGKDLFIKKLEQTIDVTKRGQLGIGPVLDLYLRRIERDQSQLPMRLFPLRAGWVNRPGEEPPKVVVIDPSISSGRPVVHGTGVMAKILPGRFRAGEGIEELARDYGLQSSQIEEVIRYAPAA